MPGTGPLIIPAFGGGDAISAGGNTAGTIGLLSNTTVILAGGNNVTLSQSGNTVSIIGAAGGTGGAAITLGESNLGNTSGTSGVISGSALQFLLAGGNNVTLSQSLNGSSITLTISAANQTNQSLGLYAVSNTTLSSSHTADARSLSFEGAGGVSVGILNNSVVISGAAGGGGNNTLGMSNLGNTSGTTGVVSGSAVEFFLAGGNNITLSQSINASTATITISAPNQSADTGHLYASSNTFGTSSGTYNVGTLSIAGSGAVSVAASNSGFVISAPAQTNQSLGLYASSNTTGQSSSSTVDARSLTIQAIGNLSVGLSGGLLVISGATAAAGTLSGYAVSNTTQGTSGTLAGNALSFQGAGNVSLGISNGSVIISGGAGDYNILEISGNTSGTTTTFSQASVALAGGNNITLSQSSNTITISGAAFSTITQGNMVTISTQGSSVTIDAFANILSVSGNTSGTLTTFSSGTMVLAGGNNITLSQSSNTITISAGAGGGSTNVSAYAVSNTTQGTSGTIAQSGFSFEGAGAISIGISNGSIVASAPIESYLVAGNNISLSSSSNSISIINELTSETISQYEPWDAINNSSASSLGQSSLYMQHFNLPDSMQVCRMDRLISLSINGTITGATNSTGTRSNVWAYNETIGAYTRGTGTNSTNLYSYMSNAWSLGITESVSVVTTVATSDIAIQASYTFGFIGNIDTNGGTTSSTFSSASSLTTAASSGTMLNPVSNITGLLALNVPFGSNLMSAGDYWLGLLGDTGATSGGTATTNASISNIMLTNLASDLKRVGQTATATSVTLIPGNGAFSAQTAAFPSSVAINAISNNSNVSLYGNFMNLSL